MSRKKSRKTKGPQAQNRAGVKKAQVAGWSAGALALGLAGWALWSSRKSKGPPAPATGRLVERRPVLNYKMFSGKAATAYRIAAEIPKVIDSQFCYCYCKRDHGHKTLLTCFTNLHGSKCDLCMGEVIYAYGLYQDGMSLDGIVEAVDQKFYRPYRRRL